MRARRQRRRHPRTMRRRPARKASVPTARAVFHACIRRQRGRKTRRPGGGEPARWRRNGRRLKAPGFALRVSAACARPGWLP